MGVVLKSAQFMEWPGFMLAAIGSFLLAIFMVIRGKMIKKEVPPDAVVTIYSSLAGSLFAATSFWFDPPKIWSIFDPHLGIFWPLAGTCTLNIFIQFGSTRAQKYADTTLVSAMGAFQPFICLLPAWLILGEMPNSAGYFGLLVTAIGIYLMSLAQKIKDPSKVPPWGRTADGKLRFTAPLAALFMNKGVKLAFLATACGAISVNFDKKSAMLSSYFFAPAVILLFVGLLGLAKVKREDWRKINASHRGWLLFAGVLYFIIIALYWQAFKYGLAMYVSSLKRLHTIFVLPMSYFILKENITKEKKYWAGVLIFVAGLFLFTVP